MVSQRSARSAAASASRRASRASTRATISEISHTFSDTPAAIAGVTRSVWWILISVAKSKYRNIGNWLHLIALNDSTWSQTAPAGEADRRLIGKLPNFKCVHQVLSGNSRARTLSDQSIVRMATASSSSRHITTALGSAEPRNSGVRGAPRRGMTLGYPQTCGPGSEGNRDRS